MEVSNSEAINYFKKAFEYISPTMVINGNKVTIKSAGKIFEVPYTPITSPKVSHIK
jgi:hypothetical protein